MRAGGAAPLHHEEDVVGWKLRAPQSSHNSMDNYAMMQNGNINKFMQINIHNIHKTTNHKRCKYANVQVWKYSDIIKRNLLQRMSTNL